MYSGHGLVLDQAVLLLGCVTLGKSFPFSKSVPFSVKQGEPFQAAEPSPSNEILHRILLYKTYKSSALLIERCLLSLNLCHLPYYQVNQSELLGDFDQINGLK